MAGRSPGGERLLVAVEYLGPDIEDPGEMVRTGIREHAFDTTSATLIAHSCQNLPRVGFPATPRGWNSSPQLPRCSDCELFVEAMIRLIIASTLAAVVAPHAPSVSGPPSKRIENFHE